MDYSFRGIIMGTLCGALWLKVLIRHLPSLLCSSSKKNEDDFKPKLIPK